MIHFYQLIINIAAIYLKLWVYRKKQNVFSLPGKLYMYKRHAKDTSSLILTCIMLFGT